MSEFKENIFFRDTSLGLLVAAARKAKAKAEGVPQIDKRAVRSQDDVIDVVETAFGADLLAPAAPTTVNLEQEFFSVIDEDEGLLTVSDGMVVTLGSKFSSVKQSQRSRATAAVTQSLKTNAVGWFASIVMSAVFCHAGSFALLRSEVRFCASSFGRLAI